MGVGMGKFGIGEPVDNLWITIKTPSQSHILSAC